MPAPTILGGLGLAVAASLLLTVASADSAHAAALPVPLGAGAPYAIVSYAGVTNVDNPVATVISGDVAASPATSAAITGFSPSTLLPGYEVHTASTNGGLEAAAAKAAETTAYLNAQAQPGLEILAELGGRQLGPDAYSPITAGGNAFQLTGDLVLDGGGSYDSVFIFTADGSLTTASNSRVLLQNGAQACNIFWRLGDDAILGTATSFVGTVLAYSAVNLTAGANVEGRLFAQTESVTLISNTITVPDTCQTGAVPAGTAVTPVDSAAIASAATRAAAAEVGGGDGDGDGTVAADSPAAAELAATGTSSTLAITAASALLFIGSLLLMARRARHFGRMGSRHSDRIGVHRA